MKKPILENASILCSLLLATLLFTPAAQGAVLVGDHFDYEDGQLADNGNAGGFSLDVNNAWTGAWRDGVDNPSNCRERQPAGTNPLGHSQCYHVSGGQAETRTTLIDSIENPNGMVIGGVAVQGVERPFTTDLAAGTTAYFGFDIKRFGNAAGVLWGMYLDEPNQAPGGGIVNGSPHNLVILDIGSNPPIVDSLLHANILSGGVSSDAGIVSDGVFHRVVAKLEFDAGSVEGAEKLSVWLDPVAETDTPVIVKDDQDLRTNNSLNGENGLGMALGIYARDVFAQPVFALDRLLLTTDFESAMLGDLPNVNPEPLPGDYDDSGEVAAGDLNLVLFNWDIDGAALDPQAWINERPDAGTNVGSEQLNGVLFNWGNMQPVAAVPEAGSCLMLVVGGLAIGLRWRAHS